MLSAADGIGAFMFERNSGRGYIILCRFGCYA